MQTIICRSYNSYIGHCDKYLQKVNLANTDSGKQGTEPGADKESYVKSADNGRNLNLQK